MKRVLTFLATIVLAVTVYAQAPQGISYQAVVRDNNGAVVINKAVTFRISVLKGSATGTAVYSETHGITSNEFGLVNLVIGKGIATIGTFSGINWGSDSYFAKVEMDVAGGSNFVEMSTSQMLSVPYALYAEKAGNAGSSSTGIALKTRDEIYAIVNPTTGMMVFNTTSKQLAVYDGTDWFNIGANKRISISVPKSISHNVAGDFNFTYITGGSTSDGTYDCGGYCWNTAHYPTLKNSNTNADGSGTANAIEGLTPETTYYVRGFALKQGKDTVYSNEISFKTLPTTASKTVSITTFNVGASYAQTDFSAFFSTGDEYGLCYDTKANPSYTSNKITYISTSASTLTTLYLSLNSNQIYYVRGYVKDKVTGTISYSNEVSFTTKTAKSYTLKSFDVTMDRGTYASLSTGELATTGSINAIAYQPEGSISPVEGLVLISLSTQIHTDITTNASGIITDASYYSLQPFYSLAVGSVRVFKLSSGKYGLFKINSIGSSPLYTMSISVKVEE